MGLRSPSSRRSALLTMLSATCLGLPCALFTSQFGWSANVECVLEARALVALPCPRAWSLKFTEDTQRRRIRSTPCWLPCPMTRSATYPMFFLGCFDSSVVAPSPSIPTDIDNREILARYIRKLESCWRLDTYLRRPTITESPTRLQNRERKPLCPRGRKAGVAHPSEPWQLGTRVPSRIGDATACRTMAAAAEGSCSP